MDYLAAGADIVVAVVDFNQTRVGQYAIHIVVEAAVFCHNAILGRIRLNHFPFFVKCICAFGEETIHTGAIIGLINHQFAIALGIIIVIAYLNQSHVNFNSVNVVILNAVVFCNPVLAGVLVVQNDAVFIEVVAPLRKCKAIGLMEPAILAVQHSTLYCSRECQALTLLQILLDCEVIIVDLAVLLDNALQTGFFFDDAAVEPIGVFSDAVNAGNVALEYAFRIKDAACGFSCSIGDQRRDTGSRVSSFGVQIVGIAVNDRPTSFLQLAILVVQLAVHIRKPAVPELPLCIQRHIAGQRKDRARIGIGSAAAIGGGVPVDELVALTGEGVGIQGSVHTDFKALRLHTAFAAVGIEGDGVEHTGGFRVLCRISSILLGNNDLRTPASEGVAVAVVRCLICAALEGRHGALQIIFLCCDLAINHPSDMCAGLGNFLALFQQLLADRAIGVAGVTGHCKRCFDRIADLLLVADSRDHFLFNNDFAANITVLALGQTRFRTGRSLCLVNDFGVTLGRNLGLCNDNLIADGAVLALSLAGFGAGRINSRINDLGMALGRDFFLGNEYSIADGAVLAFGQTSLSAGWSLCFIDYFCVAGRGDLFHTGEDRITNGALRTGRMTSLGAGSGLFRNFNRGMPGCVDRFGLGCIANCAGVGLDTGILTGRRGRDLALIPAVALGGDLFLRFDHRSADRAAGTVRQAGIGAGRFLARNGFFLVAGRGNHFLRNENFIADGAVLTLSLAGFRAGRLNGSINGLDMALSLNGLALGDFFAADGADRIAGVAVLGAGGILLVDHLGERMVVLPLGIKSGVLG